MNANAIFGLLKDTFKEWSEDKASRLGAAIAYYTIFSLAPLLVVVIAVAGLVFGQKAVQGEIVGQIQGLIGHDGAQTIQTMIANANHPATSIVATIIGLVTLLLGATGLFGELQDSLNTIWEIAPKPRSILATVKEKFLSFTMVLGIAFLLLVSLVVSAGVSALGHFLGGLLPVSELVLQAINFAISFAIITLLFALIYKVLPDAEIDWHDVWIGAAVTSLLFAIGKLAIGLYLGHSGTSSTYGAAGSLVVLLLWVYYSSQILFFGAEFTQIYSNRFGNKIRPSAKATSLRDQLDVKDLQPDTEHTDTPTKGAQLVGLNRGSAPSRELAAARASRPADRPAVSARRTDRNPQARPSPASVVFAVVVVGAVLGAVAVVRRNDRPAGAGFE